MTLTDDLKRRADALAEMAEEEGGGEKLRLDPEALKLENEIAQHFDEYNQLSISDAQPEFEYSWVYVGQRGAGRSAMVNMKKAMRVRVNGTWMPTWHVVQDSMPESMENYGTAGDTTRQIGDVVLMRCRKDLKKLLDEQEAEKPRAQALAVNSTMQGLADKFGTNLTDLNSPQAQHLLARMQGKSIAGQRFDRMLRTGTVPGMPAR